MYVCECSPDGAWLRQVATRSEYRAQEEMVLERSTHVIHTGAAGEVEAPPCRSYGLLETVEIPENSRKESTSPLLEEGHELTG